MSSPQGLHLAVPLSLCLCISSATPVLDRVGVTGLHGHVSHVGAALQPFRGPTPVILRSPPPIFPSTAAMDARPHSGGECTLLPHSGGECYTPLIRDETVDRRSCTNTKRQRPSQAFVPRDLRGGSNGVNLPPATLRIRREKLRGPPEIQKQIGFSVAFT